MKRNTWVYLFIYYTGIQYSHNWLYWKQLASCGNSNLSDKTDPYLSLYETACLCTTGSFACTMHTPQRPADRTLIHNRERCASCHMHTTHHKSMHTTRMHQRFGYHTHTPQRCVLTTLSHARCTWYCCILISWCRCWPRRQAPHTHAPQRHICTRTHTTDTFTYHCHMQGVSDIAMFSLAGAGADHRDFCTLCAFTTEMCAHTLTTEMCAYHTVTCKMYHTVTCKVYLILLYCRLLAQLLTAETLAPYTQAPQKCMHTHRHHRNACIHTGTTEMHAYTHTPETCAYHTVTCKVCLMLYSHWLVQVLMKEKRRKRESGGDSSDEEEAGGDGEASPPKKKQWVLFSSPPPPPTHRGGVLWLVIPSCFPLPPPPHPQSWK